MYKVCCMIAGIVLFLPFWALAQRSTDPGGDLLAKMRDTSRPLLIFCPQQTDDMPGETLLARQRELFQGRKHELTERDVVLLFIPAVGGPVSGSESTWAGLRHKFKVDDHGFTVVLLGKDGGEKFRSHEPVTIEKLDALIDAMPMRQQEVRDGHDAK